MWTVARSMLIGLGASIALITVVCTAGKAIVADNSYHAPGFDSAPVVQTHDIGMNTLPASYEDDIQPTPAAIATVSVQSSVHSSTPSVVKAGVDWSLARDGSIVKVYYDDDYLTHNGQRYYIGTLGKAYPDFLFSPNGNYAVGRFFKMEDDAYYFYRISTNGNPVRLREFIEEVGAVNNDRTLVYFAGGGIYTGDYNCSGEHTLVPSSDVGAMYVAFSPYKADSILYWGLPTEPSGLNMYVLDTKTGERQVAIGDNSVADALVSPDRRMALVTRLLNEATSSWLYDFGAKRFTKLPATADPRAAVWAPESDRIVFWQRNTLSTLDIRSLSVETLIVMTSGDRVVGGPLAYSNNEVVLFNLPS